MSHVSLRSMALRIAYFKLVNVTSLLLNRVARDTNHLLCCFYS